MAGCLQRPAFRGSPLCGMGCGTSVCPHRRFQQDETTLIVARPGQKIKGSRREISAIAGYPGCPDAQVRLFGCKNSENSLLVRNP